MAQEVGWLSSRGNLPAGGTSVKSEAGSIQLFLELWVWFAPDKHRATPLKGDALQLNGPPGAAIGGEEWLCGLTHSSKYSTQRSGHWVSARRYQAANTCAAIQ